MLHPAFSGVILKAFSLSFAFNLSRISSRISIPDLSFSYSSQAEI